MTAGLKTDTGSYESDDVRSLFGFGTGIALEFFQLWGFFFKERERFKMFVQNAVAIGPICLRRTNHKPSGPNVFEGFAAFFEF